MKPSLQPFEDALSALLSNAGPVSEIERVPTALAAGRVLAASVTSAIDVPARDNTQMDGYAVRAADCAGASEGVRLKVTQRIPAGQVGEPLQAGAAARIFTGAWVPPGADAVVMQEQVETEGDTVIVRHRPAPGEWIRRAGEDVRAGAEVLQAGERLSPQATGLAASIGLAELPVRRRVRVACFFTGDELIQPGEPLPPGAIYDSNRHFLLPLLRGLGCEVTDLGLVRDDLDSTRAALRRAATNHDLVLTSGGVSVGEEDHVKPAVRAEGHLDLWQVAIKPGKPLAYGRVRRGSERGEAHFIGLPGNPVSGFVTFLMLVRPFVLRLQGQQDVSPRAITLRADFDWPRPDRRREFLRARINREGGLDLFPNQGSAVLTSAVWADGLVDTPPGQAIGRGDIVRFLPFAHLMEGAC